MIWVSLANVDTRDLSRNIEIIALSLTLISFLISLTFEDNDGGGKAKEVGE